MRKNSFEIKYLYSLCMILLSLDQSFVFFVSYLKFKRFKMKIKNGQIVFKFRACLHTTNTKTDTSDEASFVCFPLFTLCGQRITPGEEKPFIVSLLGFFSLVD